METTAFTSLTTIRLPSPSRLFASSCCPDKDLLILVSRLGGIDRMSLWHSTQGFRVWEVDVGDANRSHIVGVAWSPDGQSIAVACDPPSVSFHSIQDGHRTLHIPLGPKEDHHEAENYRLSGIWWFKDEFKNQQSHIIPDIFRRGDVITGSALSVLNLLPLLDNLEEAGDKVTATDLFAFQGSNTRTTPKNQVPSVISSWPSLSMNSTSASIGSASYTKAATESSLDEVDTSNVDSLLLVTDNRGRILCYLDGSFPLGTISVGKGDISFCSFAKHPTQFVLVGETMIGSDTRTIGEGTSTATTSQTQHNLAPLIVEMPLLAQGRSRELAKLSTISRELSWYMMRIVKLMREAWFGSDGNTGARAMGPNWVEALVEKQKAHFGQNSPDPILDLTSLLTTGRGSEALVEFLGNAEQMSERSLHKWETTVSEALIKLRDFSEKKIAPACQRLHLILADLKGWARLPQYAVFGLSVDDIQACLDLAGRGVLIASWLAAVTRKELSSFREFISWLRYELNNTSTSNEVNVPRHDILEVHLYFDLGLTSSSIDSWFTGPTPHFTPADLGIPAHDNGPLDSVMKRVQETLENPSLLGRFTEEPKRNLDHIDRNLEALIHAIAESCQKVFAPAAGAATRSAIVRFNGMVDGEVKPVPETRAVREHLVINEDGQAVRYLMVNSPAEKKNALLFLRLQFDVQGYETSQIDVALLECNLPEEDEEPHGLVLELLETDFFDDESVVVSCRITDGENAGHTFISMVDYSEIGYQNLRQDGYVMQGSREGLIHDAVGMWTSGQLETIQAVLDRRRLLPGFENDSVSFALNGRVGRRIACILDNFGTMLEAIDLEGDSEDMEVADDAR